MAGLCDPLSTLRRARRMTRGRCGSLPLHRSGLSPPTPCRSPGAYRDGRYRGLLRACETIYLPPSLSSRRRPGSRPPRHEPFESSGKAWQAQENPRMAEPWVPACAGMTKEIFAHHQPVLDTFTASQDEDGSLILSTIDLRLRSARRARLEARMALLQLIFPPFIDFLIVNPCPTILPWQGARPPQVRLALPTRLSDAPRRWSRSSRTRNRLRR